MGIRDDLGDVRVSDKNAAEGNTYNRRTGKLIIREFKTSNHFKPYEFKLSREEKDMINVSLEVRPRQFLITNTGARAGPLVTKAFSEVGLPDVGVDIIRHA